jgi:hypothetical protein
MLLRSRIPVPENATVPEGAGEEVTPTIRDAGQLLDKRCATQLPALRFCLNT